VSISDRDRATLQDIVAFGREAEDLVSRGKSAYDGDVMLRRAAQMICLNLGEAAKRLSTEVRGAHPDIRFRMMMAARDKVAHGYQILDPQVIWDTIAIAIPEDIVKVRDLLGRLQ
jgi:uncharacterized protein with HEPN domain